MPQLSTEALNRPISTSSLDHIHRRADGALTIQWLRTPEELFGVEDAWRELEDAVAHRTVLSTFDYNAAWYRHYGRGFGAETLIGLAWRGSTLAGVAPLVVRRRTIGRVPLTCVEFNAHEAYAGEFLVEDDRPETAALFLDSLARSVRFDVICLNDIDLASARHAALLEAAARHRLGLETTNHPNAVVDLSRGYDAYFKARSAHFRQAVRRHARRVADAGTPHVGGVVLTRGLDQIDDALERMIAITEASHKLLGARLADCHRNFLSDLGHRFGRRGMLALPILTIGGRNAAFVMGMVERSCFYDVTLSYDEAFEKLRPGTHLIQELLRELAGRGVHTFVSHGAHDYKQHWATEFVPSTRLFLFGRGLRARGTRALRFGLAPLWNRVGAEEP